MSNVTALQPQQQRGFALTPQSLDEAMQFAGLMAKSSIIPKDYQGNPGNILIATMWGQEIGLAPLQAMQSIAVINGRPSIWGDAMLALVRGSADAAHAGDAQPHDGDRHSRSPLGDELVAVRTDKLEEVRGGFVTDGGLKVSFGIERAVYINGDLVATTTLNVGDLSRTAATGTAPAANAAAQAATGTLALIQTGPGNTFTTAPIGADALGTVIQNRLDNQQITAVTRINAAVNSASIMRSLNLQSSLRSATIDALRR